MKYEFKYKVLVKSNFGWEEKFCTSESSDLSNYVHSLIKKGIFDFQVSREAGINRKK